MALPSSKRDLDEYRAGLFRAAPAHDAEYSRGLAAAQIGGHPYTGFQTHAIDDRRAAELTPVPGRRLSLPDNPADCYRSLIRRTVTWEEIRMTSPIVRATSRRRFLQYLAGSPLFASGAPVGLRHGSTVQAARIR